MRARFLIVGGGVMGTAIALQAAQRTDPLTAPVVLVERRGLGAGSSGRSGAVLRQIYSDLELSAMARDSLRFYSGFQSRTGRALGFQRTGVISVAGPGRPDWLERLPSLVQRMGSIGIAVELLAADEIRARMPGLVVHDDALGAWEPGGGFLDPVRTVEGLAALARTYGAVTRPGVEATELVIEGGRVVAVETTEGRFEPERVVVVAGPWSRELLARAGIELPLRVVRPEQHFHELPVDESLGHAVTLADPHEDVQDQIQAEIAGLTELDEAPAPHATLIDLERDFYTRCEPSHGRTRVGRTSYAGDAVLADPDALDEDVSGEFREWAVDALRSRLPIYEDLDALGAQAAWYTLTPDAQALIGRVDAAENLIVATGFSGHGFKLAPSVAEGITQMLFDEPVSAFDEAFFDPQRFRGKEVEWEGAFGL